MITNSAIGTYGRLGNQLFQAAFLYASAQRLGTQAFINTDAPGYQLGPYRIDSTPGLLQVDHDTYEDLYEQEIGPVVMEPAWGYSEAMAGGSDHVDYGGYFQSPLYFDACASGVRRMFARPRVPLDNPIGETMVQQREFAAVGIRRGDYLDKPRFHTNLDPAEYHQPALEHIFQRLGHQCPVYVFSDDIEWCRQHEPVRSPSGVHYVDEPDAHKALAMMALADHHVIANSTFHWWAAWLSHPGGLVVAPRRWFGPDGPAPWDAIYPDGWTVM